MKTAEQKIKVKMVVNKKIIVLPNTGFYYTAMEKKDEDKVFCLYAFSDDEGRNQLIVYIPREVVFAVIKKHNLLDRRQQNE